MVRFQGRGNGFGNLTKFSLCTLAHARTHAQTNTQQRRHSAPNAASIPKSSAHGAPMRRSAFLMSAIAALNTTERARLRRRSVLGGDGGEGVGGLVLFFLRRVSV
jgi:hypothetical protein